PDRLGEEVAYGHIGAEDLILGIVAYVRRLEEDVDTLPAQYDRGDAPRELWTILRAGHASSPQLHLALECGEDGRLISESIVYPGREDPIVIHASGQRQRADQERSDLPPDHRYCLHSRLF